MRRQGRQYILDGYTDYIKDTIDKFRSMGIHASFIAGIWQDKFSPENLAEQYYNCAKDSAGYLIYTFESMSSTFPSISSTKPLANKEQYWAAIRNANIELDKLKIDPNYKTSLKNPQ